MNKKLTDHKEKLNKPLRQATLVFLVKDNQILLAMKKRGFAEGKWNGVGGKKNDNETIDEAARRETFEEIGVKVTKLNKVASLNFYFLEKPEWEQQVIAYLVNNWGGDPKESEEMAPRWFDINKIPYKEMW